MPVRMLNFVRTPPPPRKLLGRNSPLFQTPEWQDVVLALGAGLKPQEYISVEFAADDPIHQRMKRPTTSLQHNIKKKIKELGLPYDCYVQGNLVTIIGRGVIS